MTLEAQMQPCKISQGYALLKKTTIIINTVPFPLLIWSQINAQCVEMIVQGYRNQMETLQPLFRSDLNCNIAIQPLKIRL